jgi:hypothetical protein
MATQGEETGGRAPKLGQDELVRQISTVRTDLAESIGELNRRRHEFFDVRRQLRQNPIRLLAIAAALLGVAVGGISLEVARRRRRDRLGPRLSRLDQALRRMVAHPNRVATDAGVGRKIMGAAGAAAASVVARKLAQRLVGKQSNKQSGKQSTKQ